MGQIHLLGANRSYDRNEQTVRENQVTIFEGYGNDNYVVYKVSRESRGFVYHLINMRTFEFHQSDLIRPLSEKFGIGMYYDSQYTTFLDPIETAELLTKATERKAEEERKAEAERQERERITAIGAERLQKLIPTDAKAVIVAHLEEDESDPYTDYFSSRTVRSVILAFSTHQRNIFSEMRKAARHFDETDHLAEENKDYEHRENWSMGDGYYLATHRRSGWKIEKDPIYTREQFINNYAYIAGKEENIQLKPSSAGQQAEAEQETPTADLTKLNIEIVEYSEKAIAVFGDTKPIKETLKDLNGLFRANLTHKGERRAGWIFSKKQEDKVRATLTPDK